LKVLAHGDPFVVEHELLERVARAQHRDPFAPVLVVVPTTRLAQHVERRLGQRFGSRVGVHVLHYRALALRILDAEAAGTPRILTRRLRQRLLEEALTAVPPNPWSDFVRRRPGALGGLLGALDDLREAGIAPRLAAEVLDHGADERGMARIHAAYVARLDAAGERGFVDESGLIDRAAGRAEAFVKRMGLRAVLHHGAYELIGVHLRLLRALERAAPVTFLLPAEPGAPAHAYAERFARRHLLDEGDDLERLEDRAGGRLGERLRFLYDEDAAPPAPDPETVVFRNTQGAVPEIALAVRHALRRIDGDTAPVEVAVLARSLEPYAIAIESVIGDGIAVSTSASVPLRRDAAIHDLLVVLRALDEDFPRRATVEILRSPRIRWAALGTERPFGDRAEAWSREAKLLRGLEGWTRDLPAWASDVWIPEDAAEDERARLVERGRRRTERAEAMGRALTQLAARLEPQRAVSWSEHARRLERFVREVLPGCGDDDSDPAIRALLEVLEDLSDLDDLAGRGTAVPFAEMVRWLSRAVDDSAIPLEASDSGGIRILDAMQARGLTFARVFVVGMNERFFPRVPREDAFLPDGARKRLIERTGRPLPVKGEANDEEHLLLSMVLGSAREGIEVSWQRADDDGKSRTPSLALREIARVARGTPDLVRVLLEAQRVSAHPHAWLETLGRDPGLLSAGEERVLLALQSAGPEVTSEVLGSRGEGPLRGLAMLHATESFAARDPRYDARIGAGTHVPGHYSVSALERLGRCPLQFFFHDVVRIRELEEEATLFGIEARELGLQVHRALEILYSRLLSEGRVSSGDASADRARALQLVPEVWREATDSLDRRLANQLPFFWRWYGERWIDALGTFVSDDLDRISSGEWRIADLEKTEQRTLDLGKGVRASLSARFDRVLASDSRAVVGDYKSSGKLEERTDITRMLKGETMQVPLYFLLSGESAAVELIGVGPEYDPLTKSESERRARFAGFEDRAQRDGFVETVRTLLSLVSSGSFPMNPERHCSWCPYRQACRHNHPPSREREEHAADSSGFRDVQRKNKTKKPTLSLVRQAAARGAS
jgi:ATP-dependent helicase/nuclease subunit B